MSKHTSALTLWCVEDGRPGHQRQLSGLAQAIQTATPATVYRLGPHDTVANLSAPALILTAGRRSHHRGLRLRWRHGGKLVALMNPGPLRPMFDLCVVPEHDGLRATAKVILSQGPLNPVLPATSARPDCGLILVGGPSRHYRWVDEHMNAQIKRLQAALPWINWTLTTSRRTPSSFLCLARQPAMPRLQLIPSTAVGPDWLIQQYAHSSVIWVSEDSASMVYESLSCGAAVGILPVPQRRPGRVSAGIQRLLQAGKLARLEDIEALGEMPQPTTPLQEAARIARDILARLGLGR